jgi:hypothetical protein
MNTQILNPILPRPLRSAALALALAFGFTLIPAQAEQLEAGPNKGKLIGVAPDLAEVLISPEGALTVTFLDADKRPVAPGSRTASVFAQTEGGRQEVALEAKGDLLVSKEPLPKPEGYTLVIQLRSAADAKPSNTRVKYDMHVCGGCKLAEYACICAEH